MKNAINYKLNDCVLLLYPERESNPHDIAITGF